METYPIFKATFGGSSDYMAQPEISLAAEDAESALEKFRDWDSRTAGLCGTVGNLIYLSPNYGWVRPAEITEGHIKLVKDLRATRLDWFSVD
jgi:hypothetical protein